MLQEVPLSPRKPMEVYSLMTGFSPVHVQAGSDTTTAVCGCDETHFPSVCHGELPLDLLIPITACSHLWMSSYIT